MRSSFAILLLFSAAFITATPTDSKAQTAEQLSIIEKFKSGKNDSAFAAAYSKKPDFITCKITAGGNMGEGDSMLFQGEAGQVFGPYEDGGKWVCYKVSKIDSGWKMTAGNILIKYRTNDSNETEAAKQADIILKKAKKGEPFDELCRKYAEDGNTQTDCSLGSFYEGVMVQPFESAVLKHKMGDVFKVRTYFGWHVVKILAHCERTV